MKFFHQLIVPHPVTKSRDSELINCSAYLHAFWVETVYKIFYGFSVAALYVMYLSNVFFATTLLTKVLQEYTSEILKVVDRPLWQPIEPNSSRSGESLGEHKTPSRHWPLLDLSRSGKREHVVVRVGRTIVKF